MSKEIVLKGLNVIPYFIFLLVLIFFINEKSNLHMDEVSSYCGANNSYDNSISIKVDYGKKYDDTENVWLQQMVVENGHRFDYANTYNVMATDNHPPFYFYLLHTVSSIFPGKYSKWYAGAINIVFAMGILFFSRKIVMELTNDQASSLIVSFLICFSGGIISAATYFRNYFIAMFFVTAYLYLMLVGLRKVNKIFYIAFVPLAILGVMTHYYIAIFYFFASLFFVIVLCINKRIWDCLKFIAFAIGSAIVYICLDIASFETVFSGTDRSGEVFGNLTVPFGVQVAKIIRCIKIVDVQVFSGLFFIILALGIVIYFICLITKKERNKNGWAYLLSFGAILGYIIFVSIITVYETPRYYYPIYAVLIVITYSSFYNLIRKVIKKNYRYIVLVLIFTLTTMLQFKANIHYLYRSTRPFLEKAKEYADTDCIFITEHSYNVNASFYEMKNYKSITFYNYDNMDELVNVDINTENGLLISCDALCDTIRVSELINEAWPELINVAIVGTHEGNTTYYYSR